MKYTIRSRDYINGRAIYKYKREYDYDFYRVMKYFYILVVRNPDEEWELYNEDMETLVQYSPYGLPN